MSTVDWNGGDRTWTRVFEPKSKVCETVVCKTSDSLCQPDSDDELPQIKSVNNGTCMIELEYI